MWIIRESGKPVPVKDKAVPIDSGIRRLRAGCHITTGQLGPRWHGPQSQRYLLSETLCKKNSPSPALLCSPLTQTTPQCGYEKWPKAQEKHRDQKNEQLSSCHPHWEPDSLCSRGLPKSQNENDSQATNPSPPSTHSAATVQTQARRTPSSKGFGEMGEKHSHHFPSISSWAGDRREEQSPHSPGT